MEQCQLCWLPVTILKLTVGQCCYLLLDFGPYWEVITLSTSYITHCQEISCKFLLCSLIQQVLARYAWKCPALYNKYIAAITVILPPTEPPKIVPNLFTQQISLSKNLKCFFFSIARRFVHLLYSNFTAKWRNQTVGDLFLKTAARVPDKVHKEKYNT